MRLRTLTRTLGVAGLGAAALGTTCATMVKARQELRPYPPPDCLRAALATSPDVVEVTREFRGGSYGTEGYSVVLRDSTAKEGRRYANLFREWSAPHERPEDRATHLEMSVFWPGFKRPPALEERAVSAIATRLLAHLQASCAPETPAATAACSHGDGKWKPCAPAG